MASDKNNPRADRVLALAESTEQDALRAVARFSIEAGDSSRPESRATGQRALLKAAKTFTALLSMTFQAVAWNSDVLYSEAPFREAYNKVYNATEGFRRVDRNTLQELLVGICDFNFISAQNHMPATLSCQARIALATVGWVAGAAGSFLGSSADLFGLFLASNLPGR